MELWFILKPSHRWRWNWRTGLSTTRPICVVLFCWHKWALDSVFVVDRAGWISGGMCWLERSLKRQGKKVLPHQCSIHDFTHLVLSPFFFRLRFFPSTVWNFLWDIVLIKGSDTLYVRSPESSSFPFSTMNNDFSHLAGGQTSSRW